MDNDSLINAWDAINQTYIGPECTYGQHRSVPEIVICVLILLLLIVTSVLGNAAVILAVTTESELRHQNSNLFILNLAITDMTSAVVVMGSSLLFIALDWRAVHPIWCNLTCAANYLFIIVSMLTMCFISVDRYQAVLYPLLYSIRVTKTHIRCMIVYSWVQGLIFALVPVGLKWVQYDYWEGICAIDWFIQKTQAVYYVITAFMLCFALPGVGMTFNYLKIAYAARKTSKNITPQIGELKQNENEKQVKNNVTTKPKKKKAIPKVIKSLLIVVALFFICMTPFCVTKLLKVVSDNRDVVPPYANLSASFIGYLSSVVNPLIYGIFRSDFRKAYKRQFKKISCFSKTDDFNIQTSSNTVNSHHINTSTIWAVTQINLIIIFVQKVIEDKHENRW